MVHRASCSPKLERGSTGGVGLSQHSVNRFLLELKAAIIAGKTLIKVGETQRRLGAAERDFIHSASINFLTPLRNFLEGDWRTISVSMVAGKGRSAGQGRAAHHLTREEEGRGKWRQCWENAFSFPGRKDEPTSLPLGSTRKGKCQS